MYFLDGTYAAGSVSRHPRVREDIVTTYGRSSRIGRSA
jgi:hypothetical protein